MTALKMFEDPTPLAPYRLRNATRSQPEIEIEPVDPYWTMDERLWAGGPWSAAQADLLLTAPDPDKATASTGHRLVYDEELERYENALATLRQHRALTMTVLAVVHAFHAAMTDHLVSHISPRGGGTFAQRRALRTVLRALFRLGVLDTLKPAEWNVDFNSASTIWLAGDPAKFAQHIVPMLTAPELASVLAGVAWQPAAPSMIRHNVLALEVALRLAEWRDVEHLVGERFATHRDLLPDHSLDDRATSQASADAVLTRPTGGAIALELVASHGDLDDKVRRWAARLACTASLRAGGASTVDVRVIFVLALRRSDAERHAEVLRQVKKALARAAREHACGHEPLWHRIGAVGWPQWFPFAHVANDNFTRLRVALMDPDGVLRYQEYADAFMTPNQVSREEMGNRRRVLNSLAATPAFLRQPIDVLPPYLDTPAQRALRGAVQFRRQGLTVNGIPNVGYRDGGLPTQRLLGAAIWDDR